MSSRCSAAAPASRRPSRKRRPRPNAAPPPTSGPRPNASSCSSCAPLPKSRSTKTRSHCFTRSKLQAHRGGAESAEVVFTKKKSPRISASSASPRCAFAPRSVIFRHPMKRLLVICLLATSVKAEIKDRIAAVVNGQPITLSDLEERLAPELARAPAGPAGVAQRDQDLRTGLEAMIDERLVESEAHSLGIAIRDE